MKRLVVDLDDTITQGKGQDYATAPVNDAMVEKLRAYQARGFEIVIATSRNMRTHANNIGKINAQTLPVIVDWLDRHNIPYDEIWTGKPWCGENGFYIDDKAVRPDEFLAQDYESLCALTGAKPA